MTDLGDKLLPKVVTTLAKVGVSATWTKPTTTYNPDTGSTTGSDTDYTVTITPPSPYESRMIDGDLIRVGDMQVLFAGQGLAFTPEIGDRLTFAGRTWTATRINAIYADTRVAAWEAQLR